MLISDQEEIDFNNVEANHEGINNSETTQEEVTFKLKLIIWLNENNLKLALKFDCDNVTNDEMIVNVNENDDVEQGNTSYP